MLLPNKKGLDDSENTQMSLVRSPPPLTRKTIYRPYHEKMQQKQSFVYFSVQKTKQQLQLARVCLTASAIVTFVAPENIGQLVSCV